MYLIVFDSSGLFFGDNLLLTALVTRLHNSLHDLGCGELGFVELFPSILEIAPEAARTTSDQLYLLDFRRMH